ncbi:MAG: AI-2E family transporter [Neptuniibacter caesariensis]|uniref:AI-2E family transporter n=1 Tax=Neptuniibacter caesariensis TaxID=207954 RepID=A0A2G6JNZ9_NEPCE|nr:MAG: AI-2E family transporter [Neptuniibacter caesariensis]
MTQSQRWFFLILTLVLAGLVYLLAPILSPFLVGALLAYLSDPVADRLEAAGLSRVASVVIVFIALTAVVVLIFLLFIPKLGMQIQLLLERIPQALSLFETQVLPWMMATFNLEASAFEFSNLKDILIGDLQKTGDIIARLLGGVTRSGIAIAAWIANLVLIPVVTFYLLRDWDIMMDKVKRLLPRNIEPKVSLWACECDEVLGAFMKGQLLVMFALGVVYAIGLWIVGLDLALLVGMIAGLASIVPYMGFIIGIMVAGVAAFMQFQDPIVLGYVGAVFMVGQLLEGMLLTPLLVGDRIGLHPVAVIFAIMAGGQLFGFVGVLLALPVAAVIMVLLRHLHEGYKSSALYASDEKQNLEQTEAVVNDN